MADTEYRIGSITKTMVAVLVLRLVERGEIALDDAIAAHLPDAPAGDSTIYQLLPKHSSSHSGRKAGSSGKKRRR